MEARHTHLAALDQSRDLRHRFAVSGKAAVDETGMLVTEDLGVADHAFVVDPALPGTDQALSTGVVPIRGGSGWSASK